MPQILDKEPYAKVIPTNTWHKLPNTYICRTVVKNQGGRYVATSRRIPSLFVECDSEVEALQSLAQEFRQALQSRTPAALRPVRDFIGEEVNGVERWVLIAPVPSVRDIDAVYEQQELTDDEVRDLELHRTAGTARPTIPPRRVPRQ